MKMIAVFNLASVKDLREVEVVKVEGEYSLCTDGERYATAFMFPWSARVELTRIISHRAELKKQFEDSIGEIFKLRNRISRGEFQ